MTDEAEDEYGDDEPSPTRSDWVGLRERMLEQRRQSMWMDSWESDWLAHHVGKQIPELRDHPLFLATLRAHWLRADIDPDDLKADIPGVAREVERTLRQHPWQRTAEQVTALSATISGREIGSLLLRLRGHRSARS
jgi:hypothetical protein